MNGVPFVLVDDAYAIEGAQPPEAFEQALRHVALARHGRDELNQRYYLTRIEHVGVATWETSILACAWLPLPPALVAVTVML